MMRRKPYKSRRGVPKGYRHRWRYRGSWKERKLGRGKWAFRFQARKSRGGSSKGGFGRGQWIKWYIRGVQFARKTGGRTYYTDFKGVKTVITTSHRRRRH